MNSNFVYSLVVGSVMFAYIRLFNRNMETYKKSEYTLTWGEFIDGSLQ